MPTPAPCLLPSTGLLLTILPRPTHSRSQPRKPSGPGQPSVLGTRQRNDPIRPFRNLLNKLAPDNFEILFLEVRTHFPSPPLGLPICHLVILLPGPRLTRPSLPSPSLLRRQFENSILPLIQNAIVLNQVVEVMAEKIRDEPLYSDLYATFCVRLHKIETMIYGPPRDDLIKVRPLHSCSLCRPPPPLAAVTAAARHH